MSDPMRESYISVSVKFGNIHHVGGQKWESESEVSERLGRVDI